MTREPLHYIKRTRHYYQVLGYGKPYDWAQFEDVPFTKPGKSLAGMRIGIVTTAAPVVAGKGDQGPGAAYNGEAKFFTVYATTTSTMPALGISHIAYDRKHTTAEDIGTFFPLNALKQLADNGVVGSVSPRFYGLPTNRSQRVTAETDCPALLEFVRDDAVDAVILVPNCPVCHQSVTFAARHLEIHGIQTVIMGCARDIVEHVGAPRLLFNDFPLGNSAGRPGDPAGQRSTLDLALQLLMQAETPRTTWQNPQVWLGDPNWKDDYSNPDKLSEVELRAKREEFDRVKQEAKQVKSSAAKNG